MIKKGEALIVEKAGVADELKREEFSPQKSFVTSGEVEYYFDDVKRAAVTPWSSS